MNAEARVVRPPVRSERPEAGVAVLFLDRPDQRNSLSVGLMVSLRGELATIGNDPSISAIVLAAEGPVFCAGHDLKELTAHRERPRWRPSFLCRNDDALFGTDAGDRRLPQAGDRSRSRNGHRGRVPTRRHV